MPLKFLQLTSVQLEGLSRETTVFFFPVAPLEGHGPHLPLGLDLWEASRLCSMSAQKLETELPEWKGVLMPELPLGIDSNTHRVRFTVRPHVLRDWLVDSTRHLVNLGFLHFVCFSGHLGPRQLTAIEEAGTLIRRAKVGRQNVLDVKGLWKFGKKRKAPTLVSASSVLVGPKEVLKSPLRAIPSEHGGKRDTSIALVLAPEFVDPMYAYLPASISEPSWTDRIMSKAVLQQKSDEAGYWGAPAEATALNGEEALQESLDKIFPKLRAVWDGAHPHLIFSSWYRIFPPNRSFFKAWVLSFILLLLALAWVYMVLAEMRVGIGEG